MRGTEASRRCSAEGRAALQAPLRCGVLLVAVSPARAEGRYKTRAEAGVAHAARPPVAGHRRPGRGPRALPWDQRRQPQGSQRRGRRAGSCEPGAGFCSSRVFIECCKQRLLLLDKQFHQSCNFFPVTETYSCIQCLTW